MPRRRQSRADLQARLADLGQDLAAGADLTYIERPELTTSIVVLDRVVAGALPAYDVHGYAECIRCYQLCWLGPETVKIVKSGVASPICMECTNEVAREGGIPEDVETYHVDDRG